MNRDQMRSYDAVAMERHGVPGIVLMENAGSGASRVILPMIGDGRATIVCGKGNNGGDGFVIARHLMGAKKRVRVILLGALSQLNGDALVNAQILLNMRAEIHELADEADTEKLPDLISHSTVIVDAIFGTGLERPVIGRYHAAIEAINAARAPVVSVDLPSGLDADTGMPLGVCVRAARTVTFACLKRGLVMHPGCEIAGDITVVDIGAPGAIIDEVGHDGLLLSEARVRSLLSPLPEDAHKGTFGHLLVIAGSPGRSGAAILASMAALRSGAGLVTLAVPGSMLSVMESCKPPEVMLEPLLPAPDAPFDEAITKRLSALLAGKTAVAFGPGCGLHASMRVVLEETLGRAEAPAVVDADGLTLLAGLSTSVLSSRSHPTVLTPHPGEMARLTAGTAAEVQHDRVGTARAQAALRGAHVVLKGARTVIVSPDGSLSVNPTGNPGMATAGSGDVLTGMVGGLLAQGMEASDAACAAVYLHGLAGDRAAEVTGQRALVAGDILEHLPDVMRDMEESQGPGS